jgi:MinD superfamily P-loop ATPase
MPRPRKWRRIADTPRVFYFKPQWIPLMELDEVCLLYEGHEALRLADLEGMTQEEAPRFPQKYCGQWYVSSTRFGPMVHAQLIPGAENSGRLVMVLKQQARELAKVRGLDLVLCDGASGIGGPVISSLSGTHLAVAVTEPTPSGRHDLERVADLCRHFQVTFAVILNKHDLNLDEAARIEAFCRERSYPVLARLPHDPIVTRAMIQGLVATELLETEFSRELRHTWARVEELAKGVG